MLAWRFASGGDVGVGYHRRLDQERIAQIVTLVRSERSRLFDRGTRRVDDLCLGPIAIDLVQDARAAVAHEERGGKDKGRDVGDLALDNLDLKTGAGSGALVKRNCQPPIDDG